MGKRNKRLTMKKYAIKYAAIRKNRVEEIKEAPEPAPEEVIEEVTPNALKQLESTEPASTPAIEEPAAVEKNPPKKTIRKRRRKAKTTTKKTTKATSES